MAPASPFSSMPAIKTTAANTSSWNSIVDTDGINPPTLSPMASNISEAATALAIPILFIFVSK